jgi:hypothetical protein
MFAVWIYSITSRTVSRIPLGKFGSSQLLWGLD